MPVTFNNVPSTDGPYAIAINMDRRHTSLKINSRMRREHYPSVICGSEGPDNRRGQLTTLHYREPEHQRP